MLAVFLIAALTFAITKSQDGSNTLATEKMTLAVNNFGSLGADLRRAIEVITRSGQSETTLSFAQSSLTGYGTPDANTATEVFNIAGGGATYLPVPAGVNNGSQWEFYGFTRAPYVGDDAAPDLMLVLPNVNETFCRALNKRAGYAPNDVIPTDTATCLHDTTKRFAGSFATGGDINAMTTNTFRQPATFACVACAGPVYHAYYVLIER